MIKATRSRGPFIIQFRMKPESGSPEAPRKLALSSRQRKGTTGWGFCEEGMGAAAAGAEDTG